MCGIAGYIGDSSDRAEPIVAAMTDCMARRGPDASGMEKWPQAVLGHRRLSIFDLSDAGLQPMLSPNRSIGVVFNGAIYNFPSLRLELEQLGYRFLSQTDTEVIVHGYDAWGVDRLVSKLRGMFAIGIWDNRAEKLILIRDRLGVKPLIYASDGQRVAFASTVRAVASSGLAGGIDAGSIAEFLEFGFITDGRTVYENVHKVPAATIIEFSNGRENRRTYWQSAEARPDGAISFEEALDQAESIFLDAVKLRLKADVPVGALLSGGVDSSLVCWAIAKLGGDIRTFTIGTPGDPYDETADAAATARDLGIEHSIINLSADDWPDLNELVDAYGEPFACASALGMIRLSRAIRPSATVLLTGDGGDDCFLGYPEHKNFYLAQKLARHLPSGLAGLWKSGGHRSPLPFSLQRAAHFLDYATGGLGAVTRMHDGLHYYQHNGLLGPRLDGRDIDQHSIPPSIESARHLLRDFLNYDRDTRFTGEYLTKVDGGAMYFALEARSPFLDQELWNFAQSLPYSLRLQNGTLKAILRALAARRLGQRVATGKKRGFGIPVNRWLSAKWKQPMLDVLSKSRLGEQGWISADAVAGCLRETAQSGHVPNQLWYIYVLESWLRHESAPQRQTSGMYSLT
ncbi:MAG TPA: asparagine synthase (glutamine-hydrolyzing) [Bryobacteraceae bacterium]|nr:asparagine synthase (glutamine-hydrolyzing) [Bryobacteraceae bacterium]